MASSDRARRRPRPTYPQPGTSLRIRKSGKISTVKTDTDGWEADIGNLGKGMPILEIWLDRFSGYPERKLYACFWSRNPKRVHSLSRTVSTHLWKVRRLTMADTIKTEFHALKDRLPREEFNAPIIENYPGYRSHFFGFYDRTGHGRSKIDARFCERAVDFFLDVARLLPGAKEAASPRGTYSGCENRKWVKAHLGRERSGYLATQCKERDSYRCKVCDMTFAKVYGDDLGALFAEAHHLVPLGKQPDNVLTKLEDLTTVCANCHRMLHRMDGKPGDVKKLRAIVQKHHGKKS